MIASTNTISSRCSANARSHWRRGSYFVSFLLLVSTLGTLLPMQASAQTFADVPVEYWAYEFIENISGNGITGGCGGGNYCPGNLVTRAQMAVFLERGMHGGDFVPPAATGEVFGDVEAQDFAAAFIEQFSADGITNGCGGGNYCPDDNITRAQMAVFLLRSKYGAGYAPPPATGVFDDVSPGDFADAWIEQLAADGITSGCGDGDFCPDDPATRAQMAVFIVRAFNLVDPNDAVGISISSPDDATQIQRTMIDVEFSVSPYDDSTAVELDGFPLADSNDGTFFVEDYPLLTGQNTLEVVARNDDGAILGTAEVQVTVVLPSEASALITPEDGGRVFVAEGALQGVDFLVPPDAAQREFLAQIVSEPEFMPDLPYKHLAIGPVVSLMPIGEVFADPVTLTLPVDVDSLPQGVDINQLVVLANTDAGWVELPIHLVDVASLVLAISEIDVFHYIVVYRQPIPAGALRIITAPLPASVYVDGTNTGDETPTELLNFDPGPHELKLYFPGYNEEFIQVDVATDSFVDVAFEPAGVPAPVITISPEIPDGLQTDSSVLDISGFVTFDGSPLADTTLVFSVNGEDTLEFTDAFGVFNGAVTLLHGENVVQVRATGPNGNTASTQPISVHLGSPDITARLSWNTNSTDLDLHVFDPLGNHAYWSNLGGIPGGMLDRDDVNGFGPEIFTLTGVQPGTYQFNVDSFIITDSTGLVPTRATLVIWVGTEVVFNSFYTFTNQDLNAGNGTGSNSASFWDAYDRNVGDLVITRVTPSNNQFTTRPGENLISVTIAAPAQVPDQNITVSVEEVIEECTVNTDGATGRNISFLAAHTIPNNMSQKFDGTSSNALLFEIIARILAGGQSLPRLVLQDVRSQIRQEYVDKCDFYAGFERGTPSRAQIIDASGFTALSPNYFSFNQMRTRSHYSGRGFTVIGANLGIAHTLRANWSIVPAEGLRLNSAWRNPRYNDPLPLSDTNSFHQTGDAVDIAPKWNGPWPGQVQCNPANLNDNQTTISLQPIQAGQSAQNNIRRQRARAALNCLARRLFRPPVYNIDLHGGHHLHIERESADQICVPSARQCEP